MAADADMMSLSHSFCVSMSRDRRALLTGLLNEVVAEERSQTAVAHSPKKEEHTALAVAAQQGNAEDVNSRDWDESSSKHSLPAISGKDRESSEATTSSLASDRVDHSAASPSNSPVDAVALDSPSVPVASSRPTAPNLTAAFPFFPYVVSDPSCCLAAASLTSSLAANDSRISSAVLDCVLAALNDALQAQTHRVFAGIAVANAPLHSDSSNQQPAATGSPWQQSPHQQSHRTDHPSAVLVAGVHDFVGPLTVLSALLSLSDRLIDSRVDECLSRLLVLARRVCARRHSAVSPPSSQCINGSEERFLLSFVRCVLQLAANHKPIAAWLRAHAMEWHFLETLYTQARHLTGIS